MIYECLIAPTEQPYSLSEIKKALLTYDKVKILDPSDRDIMPSSLYLSALGVPPFFGIDGQPIRPMGKTLGYDEQFDKIITELNPAIKQGLLEVVSVFEAPNEKDSLTFFIGIPPRYEYPLHERFVCNLYHGIAEQQQLINNMIIPSKHALLDGLNAVDNLAMTGFLDGNLPFFMDPLLSEKNNRDLTLIARARIATLIKCAGFCEAKDIIPIFNGSAYGPLLTHIMNKSKESLSEIQDDDYWIRRNRTLELCHEEFIDPEVLASVSIKDLIKLRTSVWGANATHREELFASVSEIALEIKDDETFKTKTLEKIEKYRQESESLISERRTFGFNIKCALTSATLSAGPAVAGLTGQISLGASMALTLTGAATWAVQQFKENKTELEKIKTREKEMKRSACFGLHNFYSRAKLN